MITRRASLLIVVALWIVAEAAPRGLPQFPSETQPAQVLTLPAAVPQIAFELVAAFDGKPRHPAGRLLEVKPGVFLGASTDGGAFADGTVFVIFRTSASAWTTRTVHSFTGSDGRNPMAGLIRGHDGNFYGTTSAGGAHNLGTVFRMTNSGAVTTLHAFAGADGAEPRASLLLASDGTMWGTTYRGGGTEQGGGTIFRMTENGSLTTMHVFSVPEDGTAPTAGLVQSTDGLLYGTTSGGGVIDGAGVAFRLTSTGDYIVLHRFDRQNAGVQPIGGLIQGSDGNFYGTTSRGPAPDARAGAVFRMTPDGTVTALHSFDGTQGFEPETGLVQASDGAFYGTTMGFCCDANSGSIFRVNADGQFTTLAVFGVPLGTAPSELIQASDGLLYGTTPTGDLPPLPDLFVAGSGAAFSLPTTGPVTQLVTFSSDRPRSPTGRLIEPVPGEFYGTSCRGGLYDNGTVFKLSAAGLQTLYSFAGTASDGACPDAGLTPGPDHETFYGTTIWGAGGQLGIAFKITRAGALTILYKFAEGEEGHPSGELAVGTDGNLYGLTAGMAGFPVTVYRFPPNEGTPTFLYHFPTGLPRSFSGLVAAADGSFYGATLENKARAGGRLFRVSQDGTAVTLIHEFTSTFRGQPAITVIQGRDGNLYGTESSGGTSAAGAVFKSSLTGSGFSVLHSFTGADGYNPTGRLFETSSGFFGTTYGSLDGSRGFGTVFFMTPTGAVTTLHGFNEADGANPYAGVIRAADGSLYGTTIRGGPGGAGVIYRIRKQS